MEKDGGMMLRQIFPLVMIETGWCAINLFSTLFFLFFRYIDIDSALCIPNRQKNTPKQTNFIFPG